MRTWSIVLAGCALVLGQPVVAQDEGDAAPSQEEGVDLAEGMMSSLFSLFEPEPLTAEQQARLPAASAIVDAIVPPGTMGEMIGSMFDGFLGPFQDLASEPSPSEAAERLGFTADQLDLDAEQAAEVLALLDPIWRERQERTMAATKEAMGTMMSALEPALRSAMSELYAIHFDERELADIGAFFATPSGRAYARKSFTMSSDPRMAGSMMQAMPQMIGPAAEIEATMKAALADLPPPRTYADLDAAQRARLAALTGLEQEDIELGMERAAENGDDEWQWDGEEGEPACCGPGEEWEGHEADDGWEEEEEEEAAAANEA